MKKIVLKITAVIGIAALTILNLGFNEGQNSSLTSFATLKNTALAGTENGGGGSGSGLLWEKVHTTTPCTYQKTTTVSICGGIIYYGYVNGCYQEVRTVNFNGHMTRCDNGWWFCISGCEG